MVGNIEKDLHAITILKLAFNPSCISRAQSCVLRLPADLLLLLSSW